MSSFLRSIQRTTKQAKDKKGKPVVKSRRAHFGGRGAKLGTKNPKDPCANRKFKRTPKPWRTATKVDPATVKPKLPRTVVAQPRAPKPTRAEACELHRAKMLRKARARPLLRAGRYRWPASQ